MQDQEESLFFFLGDYRIPGENWKKANTVVIMEDTAIQVTHVVSKSSAQRGSNSRLLPLLISMLLQESLERKMKPPNRKDTWLSAL